MRQTVERFTNTERLFHWSNALAVLFLAATGGAIWLHLDHKLRLRGLNFLQLGHVWLGGGLLVLGALGFVAFRKRRVRASKKRFNAGQRINLRLFQAALIYMVASGTALYFGRSLHLSRAAHHLLIQTHLIAAIGVVALIVGHVGMVFVVPKNRGIFAAMWTGRVRHEVAARVSPEWAQALEAQVECEATRRWGTLESLPQSQSSSQR